VSITSAGCSTAGMVNPGTDSSPTTWSGTVVAGCRIGGIVTSGSFSICLPGPGAQTAGAGARPEAPNGPDLPAGVLLSGYVPVADDPVPESVGASARSPVVQPPAATAVRRTAASTRPITVRRVAVRFTRSSEPAAP
jgi:hypothetical protein